MESYVTKSRDRKAALKFLKKTMKRHGHPLSLVTDKLRSDCAAMREIGNADCHETGRWRNNRAETSHRPSTHQFTTISIRREASTAD
ncbi:DDE-type integrase/transposase/recombinase [Cohaesibacter celericrescens]|uniref:DDE-type integrase/transposase/recombinase n=1 Tax=Cohaesibacter celericrescens TaxID=2067669 RepID=UPI001AEC7D21